MQMANEKQPKIKISSRRKDINFFALKKVKRKGMEMTVPPWVISILVPSLVVAVIACVYIYNQTAIRRLENELAASQLQIEHANVDKQRPYMAKKTVERDIFSTYYKWIENLNSQFEYYQNVQSDIPDALTEQAAGLVTFDSFAAADGKITIHGYSESMTSIAEFQRKCMEIEDVDTAFVSNISRTSAQTEESIDGIKQVYTFDFTATFEPKNSMMKEAND
jgi:hypothetical protein